MAYSVTFTLVGGPTVLIELPGLRLLTDPTFDAPGSYPSGSVTLTKDQGPAIPADAIGTVDAVLLSHDQHADNLDRSGRAVMERAAQTYTTMAGAARIANPRVRGLAPWETVSLAGAAAGPLWITATPARHGPIGIEPIAGDVIGFAVGRTTPGDLLYVSGDTVWYEGVAEVAARFDPKVVILFTGSAKTRGSFHLTMDTNDAIAAAHAFPRAKIIAVHNDSWAHFTETADDLTHAFTALGLGDRLVRLAPGEPVTMSVPA